jgi:hypothetical protein
VARVNRARQVAGIGLVLVLLVAASVAGVRWWQHRNRSDLERALAYAPGDTVRFSWTDWAGVRRELGADVDADSPVRDVEDFLSDGFDADLTSTSSMVDSTDALQADFGFSPAVVDWELLSQGTTGSVALMGLPDSLDVGELGDTFEELGYEQPEEATGVWKGGEELLARMGPGISPQFNYLALDADRQLLLASDSAAYLDDALDSVDDDVDHGLDDVARAVREPLSAALYTGDQACRALAMSQADDGEQATADGLIAAAGEVNPMTGFAIGAQPGRDVLVAMSFESDDQARQNADSRAALASGPAPGQGGDFADRFELGDVTADGRVVTMELQPVEGSYVLSDLSNGPVLFATC